jgi:hypothetical protein
MTPLTALTAIRLRDPDRFPDIGTRTGVVLRVDGGVVVRWRGIEGETTLRAEDLEMVEKLWVAVERPKVEKPD